MTKKQKDYVVGSIALVLLVGVPLGIILTPVFTFIFAFILALGYKKQ